MNRYPGGFQHPDMLAIGKKHKMEQLIEFAQTHFVKARFRRPVEITENLQKLVSRSSMVSVFEKTRFRDHLKTTPPHELEDLCLALRERLHGNSEKGFCRMVDLLAPCKLAKWPLISVVSAYHKPDDEVFMKPTTVKGVVEYFELNVPKYQSKPAWSFYADYRDHIHAMKAQVDPSLSPSNAAFSGFLMMSLGQL